MKTKLQIFKIKTNRDTFTAAARSEGEAIANARKNFRILVGDKIEITKIN